MNEKNFYIIHFNISKTVGRLKFRINTFTTNVVCENHQHFVSIFLNGILKSSDCGRIALGHHFREYRLSNLRL